MRAQYLIAVLTHGWVLAGVVLDQTEEAVTFSRAAVLRRYGTTRGLGELAHGPLAATAWDPIPTAVRIPVHALVYTIAADGWECLERDAAPAREVRRGR